MWPMFAMVIAVLPIVICQREPPNIDFSSNSQNFVDEVDISEQSDRSPDHIEQSLIRRRPHLLPVLKGREMKQYPIEVRESTPANPNPENTENDEEDPVEPKMLHTEQELRNLDHVEEPVPPYTVKLTIGTDDNFAYLMGLEKTFQIDGVWSRPERYIEENNYRYERPKNFEEIIMTDADENEGLL